jgi:5-methylcytosine-specific restriction endonuclease McrA
MPTPKIGWAAFNAKRADYLKAYFKKKYLEKQEEKIARSREWYLANKEEALKRQKEYRQRKPLTDEQKARRLQKAKDRREADPEKYRAKKRISHLRRAGPMPSLQRRKELMENLVCSACGSTEHPEIDHIMPISLGGTSEDSNLQILCRPCNRSKGSKHPDDWKGRNIRVKP